MSEYKRDRRLVADLEAMEALKAASTILDFRAPSDPPDRYLVTFRGAGLGCDETTGCVERREVHECDIRLPLSYPKCPPEIRWQTPLFHPNVFLDGTIRLDEVGIVWSEDLGLDAVCERLWDVARWAYYDLDRATNVTAKRWWEEACSARLPTDPRPLRDQAPRWSSNVVRYERRGGKAVVLPDEGLAEDDVLYIDEDTPVPPIPLARRRKYRDDDDVLYIEDD